MQVTLVVARVSPSRRREVPLRAGQATTIEGEHAAPTDGALLPRPTARSMAILAMTAHGWDARTSAGEMPRDIHPRQPLSSETPDLRLGKDQWVPRGIRDEGGRIRNRMLRMLQSRWVRGNWAPGEEAI